MKHLWLAFCALFLCFSCAKDAPRTGWKYAQLLPHSTEAADCEKLSYTVGETTLYDSENSPIDYKILSAGSVHAALLYELGAADLVVGVCDAGYVVDSTLRRALLDGRLADFGNMLSPDRERMVEAGVNLILAPQVEGVDLGQLSSLGIPFVACADYMEATPLGRAEWMRYYGRLVGHGAQADSLFQSVEESYLNLCREGKARRKHPLRLLTDLPQGGTWLQPAGGSYLAALYADAGLLQCCRTGRGAGSVALSVEQVVAQAADADVWLIKYASPHDLTYTELLRQCPVAERIKAYRERKVWGCNTLCTPYYEQVPFHPDRLLDNLIHYAGHYFVPLGK